MTKQARTRIIPQHTHAQTHTQQHHTDTPPPTLMMVRLAREDVLDTGTASRAAVLHRCFPSHPQACDLDRWFRPRPAPAYAAGPFLVPPHHKPRLLSLLPTPHHRLIVMGPESRETYAAVITSMRFARFSSQGHVLL